MTLHEYRSHSRTFAGPWSRQEAGRWVRDVLHDSSGRSDAAAFDLIAEAIARVANAREAVTLHLEIDARGAELWIREASAIRPVLVAGSALRRAA
jgi:hypothetical protein